MRSQIHVPAVSTNISICLHESSPRIKLKRPSRAWDVHPNSFLCQQNGAENCIRKIRETDSIMEFRLGTTGLQISWVFSLGSTFLWGLPQNLAIKRTLLHSVVWSLSSPGREGMKTKQDLSFFRCCLPGISSFIHTATYTALPAHASPRRVRH